jgi:hypothetical protein
MPYDPDVARSFTRNTDGSFTALSDDILVSNPAYSVIDVAFNALRNGLELDLPAGYDTEVLNHIGFMTGGLGIPARISPHQARELADLGRQLLADENAGNLEMSSFRRQSIEYLVSLIHKE